MTPGPLPDAPIGRIRRHPVGLRRPRALETPAAVVGQPGRGQLSAIEATGTLLAEEFTVREGRRIKAALQMARLAIALGVEAIRAGHSVHFSPLADIVEPRGSPDIDSLAKAEREGRLRERIRFLCRASLLIIDEIGSPLRRLRRQAFRRLGRRKPGFPEDMVGGKRNGRGERRRPRHTR